MCGIVGYVGKRPCRDLLINGLQKLEYRGYDSAGISLLEDGHIDSVRAVGNLANLKAAVGLDPDSNGGGVAVAAPPATIGLAHTRWATHGRVTEENAHPTATARTKSTSSLTELSRTIPTCAPSFARRATSSRPKRMPRSSPT